jgi:phosphate transport system ATP-binding protein
MVNTKISIKNLNLWFGKKQVLIDINMDIAKKTVTAIMGPSGCGKSTFLRCLNRLNDLTDGVKVEGEITIDNKNAYGNGTDVATLRRKVGMVFQKPNPFPKSIYDNIAYGLRINNVSKKKIPEIVEESLRAAALWVEVKDRLNESAMELSGGQQQRLCIARAIAIEPEVILMDEPCSSLDPAGMFKIEDLIEKLKEKYSIIVVTHNMQQAARISNFTAFLYLGKVVEFGDTNQIFTKPKEKLTENYISGNFG